MSLILNQDNSFLNNRFCNLGDPSIKRNVVEDLQCKAVQVSKVDVLPEKKNQRYVSYDNKYDPHWKKCKTVNKEDKFTKFGYIFQAYV